MNRELILKLVERAQFRSNEERALKDLEHVGTCESNTREIIAVFESSKQASLKVYVNIPSQEVIVTCDDIVNMEELQTLAYQYYFGTLS